MYDRGPTGRRSPASGLGGPGSRHDAHERVSRWFAGLDDISYGDVSLTGIVGHRQVTDAYLAGPARTKHARLATLDRGMAQLPTDVVDLLPD